MMGAALGDFCQKQTKGFRLQNCFSSHPHLYPSTPLTSEEKKSIEAILQQPFYFLKKGQQCFAFTSKDEKYVLKLFRWDKLEDSSLTRFLPNSSDRQNQKRQKQQLDFTSYQIAYKHLKEETGLIFLTLAPQKDFDVTIEVYDNLHIKHNLKANSTCFILQKKVDDFYPYFIQNSSEKEESKLYPFFLSLAEVLEKRSLMGISDSDITLQYNMGILEGKPVLFDIGNLHYQETTALQEARLILLELQTKNPSLSSWLTLQMQEKKHELP
jgi:hypothetical protein